MKRMRLKSNFKIFFAALFIFTLSFLTASAEIPKGTVLIGNTAYDLNYANNADNQEEIRQEVVKGKAIYVKGFDGEWTDNLTAEKADKSLIQLCTYKDSKGVLSRYAEKDGDSLQLKVESITFKNAKEISIKFSESVDKSSAENKLNYRINGEVLHDNDKVALSDDGQTVLITLENAIEKSDTSSNISVSQDIKDSYQITMGQDYKQNLTADSSQNVQGQNAGTTNASTPVNEDTKSWNITLSVIGDSSKGTILSSVSVTLQEDDTPYTVLKRQLGGRVISSGSDDSAYVTGIDGLKALDDGAESGWMYSVNGTFPNMSASSYELKNGDIVTWRYTTNFGKDIGAPWNDGNNKNNGGSTDNGKTASDSTISPSAAAFDLKNETDISIALTLNGNTLSSITCSTTDSALKADADYTVSNSGNTVTIRKEYLAKQAEGTLKFTFSFSAGSPQILIVNVSSTSADASKSLSNVLDYYKNVRNHNITSWWDIVALKGAGVDFKTDKSWTLPEWDGSKLDKKSSYPTDYAGYILGELSIGNNPDNIFGGRNIAAELSGMQNTTTTPGAFGVGINNQEWSIIALDTAGKSYNTDNAVKNLLTYQNSDGGFRYAADPSDMYGGSSDPDDTGMALAALSKHKDKAGVSEAINKAIAYIKNIQCSTGGFASWGTDNPNSTAAIISGLKAVGEDVQSDAWKKNGNTMLDDLVSFQKSDGSFYYPGYDAGNLLATEQSFIALDDLVNNQPVWSIIHADTSSDAGKSLSNVLDYYKNVKNHNITSWWDTVALKGAGVDFKTDKSWTLPEWDGSKLDKKSSYPTDYAGYILGELSIGNNPDNIFGGRNIAAELSGMQNTSTTPGAFGVGINNQEWSIIALDAAGEAYNTDKAVKNLITYQNSDGGFRYAADPSDMYGGSSGPDDTGMALIALSKHKDKTGVSEVINKAIAYIKNIQCSTGGFASWGTDNPNSTAAIISGLMAVGEDVQSDTWKKNGNTMLDDLVSFQKSDGSFYYPGYNAGNLLATEQSFIALDDLVNNKSVWSIITK